MKSLTHPLAALLLALGLALPGAALACPGGGKGGGMMGKGPSPHKMVRVIEKNAEKLGIEQATIEQIEGIVEANRAEAEALRAQAREAREALKAAMQADNPDKAQVLALSERAGQARVAMQQHKMAVMLDIRALLTPDQQAALKQLRAERFAERGKWGKKGKKGKRGKGDWQPPAEE